MKLSSFAHPILVIAIPLFGSNAFAATGQVPNTQPKSISCQKLLETSNFALGVEQRGLVVTSPATVAIEVVGGKRTLSVHSGANEIDRIKLDDNIVFSLGHVTTLEAVSYRVAKEYFPDWVDGIPMPYSWLELFKKLKYVDIPVAIVGDESKIQIFGFDRFGRFTRLTSLTIEGAGRSVEVVYAGVKDSRYVFGENQVSLLIFSSNSKKIYYDPIGNRIIPAESFVRTITTLLPNHPISQVP